MYWSGLGCAAAKSAREAVERELTIATHTETRRSVADGGQRVHLWQPRLLHYGLRRGAFALDSNYTRKVIQVFACHANTWMNFVIVCLEVIIGPITVSFTGVANLERKQFHREPKEFSNSVKGRGKTKQGANLKKLLFFNWS